MDEKELVGACLRNDRSAQKELYDRFSPLLMGLCARYANSNEEAEDILIEGFTKIFANLPGFKFESSLLTWMKRIVLNGAISHFRMHHKHHNQLSLDGEQVGEWKSGSDLPSSRLMEKDLLALIQRMPEPYRIVFNLHVVEGYSHREIAESLEIQESTSRSQLTRARNWLKDRLR